MNHLEIIAVVTRHLGVNKYPWSWETAEPVSGVIVGFRPQKSASLVCYLVAAEWLPVNPKKKKSDSMEIKVES